MVLKTCVIMGDEIDDQLDVIIGRHRKEKKELQSEIQKLKHAVSKGDKKRKKEVAAQTDEMEKQMKLRQELELQKQDNTASSCNVQEATSAVESISMEETKEDIESHYKKPSKAERRRGKKKEKEKTREENIQEQEVHNLMGPRHIEASQLKTILTKRGIKVSEVAADGNCLYAAVADQLSQQKIQTNVQTLRNKISDYMKCNTDTFLPFLIHEQTGELYSEAEYNDYCETLKHTPAWGGQLEIQALVNVLEYPIEVIQANLSSMMTGTQYDKPPLVITYHRHAFGLGEHYNSVVPRTPDDEEEEDFT